MFNLYIKKKQRREINEVRSRALGHFFFLNFAGFIFIAHVGWKKMRWPLGGIFELPTWFITTFLFYNTKISDNIAEFGKVPRMLAAFPR
jgi:hypothetical protein